MADLIHLTLIVKQIEKSDSRILSMRITFVSDHASLFPENYVVSKPPTYITRKLNSLHNILSKTPTPSFSYGAVIEKKPPHAGEDYRVCRTLSE
jgi:hypothetical protein